MEIFRFRLQCGKIRIYVDSDVSDGVNDEHNRLYSFSFSGGGVPNTGSYSKNDEGVSYASYSSPYLAEATTVSAVLPPSSSPQPLHSGDTP